MPSVFVKNLHPNVTESTLYQKFSSIGPLLSLRVCREAGTNRSLGYAYVNFSDQIHVHRAVETMDFYLLEGKPIRVMRSERNPLLRKIDQPNVFVKNLDAIITDRELLYLFPKFGNVLSCKVAKYPDGVSMQCGFVQLGDNESAKRSIEHLNGLFVNNKKLCVERFTKRKMEVPQASSVPVQRFKNVYVKNIDKDFNDQNLKEMFDKFGIIASHKLMTESDGTSSGFGFVSFGNAQAFNATSELNGHFLPSGKALYVGCAHTKVEKAKSSQQGELTDLKGKLLVINLDDTIDDNRLRIEFQCYGTVISAKVIMN